MNLLSNAIKFTERGEIRLSIFRGEGSKIHFVVRDTGCGIPKKSLAQLFRPFVQLGGYGDKGGTGLGLFIAHRLVQMMGGELKVKSKLGEGTEFYFALDLPAVAEAALVESRCEKGMENYSEVKFKGLSCLVVEDNAVNRKIMLKQLEICGCNCDWTEDGYAAVEMCRQKQYELIFMDYNLPGQNGSDATAQIRRLPGYADKKACVIIATTASIFPLEIEEERQKEMNGFMPKPYNLEDLKKNLEFWFSGTNVLQDF